MKSLNRFEAIGNVGKEVNYQYTGSGTLYCKFSLAIADSQKKGDEYVEKTDWVDFTLWGKLAETAKEHGLITTGAKLWVEARVSKDKYEKNGETRYSYNFRVQNFQVLLKGKDAPETEEAAESEYEEPDIPF